MTRKYNAINAPKHNTIRINRELVPVIDPTLHYNGGAEEYEDIADYMPRNLAMRGTVIA